MRDISSSTLIDARRLTVVAHFGFIFIGIVTTMLGTLLPSLTARWSLDDAHAGYFFSAQFTGALIGSSMCSPLAVRYGCARMLMTGFIVTASGVAALGIIELPLRGLIVKGWAGGLSFVFIYGIGIGITIPLTNLLVSFANPTRRAAMLNLLNFAWSIGAVTSPFFVLSLKRENHLITPLLSLAALLVLTAFALLVLGRRHHHYYHRRRRRNDNNGAPANVIKLNHQSIACADNSAPMLQTIRDKRRRKILIIFIACLMFLYVGTENAVGGWAASYAQRIEASQVEASATWAASSAASIFWFALLLGRLLASALLSFIKTEKLILSGLLIALFGFCFLLMTSNLFNLSAGVFMVGLGLANVFPSTIALLPHYLSDASSSSPSRCSPSSPLSATAAAAARITAYLFAFASLGGATLPWLVGFVSSYFSSLRAGFLVAFSGGVLMIALQLAIAGKRVSLNRPTQS